MPLVPHNHVGLRDWAYVTRNPVQHDSTCAVILFYKHPHVYPNALANTVYPVGIHVQGFIERVNLRALGNWLPGRKSQTALQQIVLNSGRDYGDVLSKYKVAVGEVINSIYRCLDYHPQDSSTESHSMTIWRRIFTKVASWNHNRRSVLEPGDDSLDHMHSLNDEWKVLSKVSIGIYVPDDVDPADGYKAPRDTMSLNEGDFVDVCIGFDIVTHRDRQGKTIHQVPLTIDCCGTKGDAMMVVEDEVLWIIPDNDNIYLNADLGSPLPEGALVVCGATFTIDCSYMFTAASIHRVYGENGVLV
ncbi:hypothetical protein B0H13DRAFT_1893490 [Mycena leptocephala]|nr:hypothetical protein B0H13DRAFT_1893490 [Mycena leptocephala]